LRRRKTTTKRSQPREYGQLLHRWVYPGCFHLALDVAPVGVVTQTATTWRGFAMSITPYLLDDLDVGPDSPFSNYANA
jgi:hypothetical protein